MAVFYNEASIPKIKLQNIKGIKRQEDVKHGKKSAAYSIIKEFSELNMSDIAIYAAIYLSKIKQKPLWTVDELKDQLTRKDFIEESLLPLLEKSEKFQSLPEPDKKAKALLIAQSIADSEAEVVRIVNEHISVTGSSQDNTLAHQLTPGQLRQLLATITKIVGLIKKLYADGEEFKEIMASMTWYTDSKNTTNAWFATLLTDLSGTIGITLRDIKDMKQDSDVTEKEFATLNSLQKQFEGFNSDLTEYQNMNILWPESENDIKGLTGLNQYFKELEAYRAKAKTIINQYVKRKDKLMNIMSDDEADNVAIEAQGWNDEKLSALIRKTLKDNYEALVVADIKERADFMNIKAEELLANQKGLRSFMAKDSYDPESELAGLLAKAAKDPNIFKGRKQNIENQEEF